MAKQKEEEVKTCFIVTPIGQIGSPVNKKAFGLIDAVIAPVLAKFNYKAVAASDISKAGSINKQIIKHLTEDGLVIANLTGLNPNVMYELAVRHAIRKPVIMMMEKGDERLPFDVVDQRTIFYDDTLNGVNTAKALLEEFITAALEEKKVQNPIYDSIEANQIIESITTDEKPLQYIIDRLDKIENRLSASINRNRETVDLSRSSDAWLFTLKAKESIAETTESIEKALNIIKPLDVTIEVSILKSQSIVELTIMTHREAVVNFIRDLLSVSFEIISYNKINKI